MARAKAAPAPVTSARLREVLGMYRYNFSSERELQDGIAQVLFQRGIRFDREVRLAPGDVIDFLVEGVGLEVKVEGGPVEIRRQLLRYAKAPRVTALLLVTRKAQHDGQFPRKLGGKDVAVLTLGEASL